MQGHHTDVSEDLQDSASAMAFVRSKMFSNIFAEGMELVEETATYLDSEGREASKSLNRSDALSYASLSMRLTTKLMQIASWLLVLRAVREEEMSYDEASQDKYRLGPVQPTREAKAMSEDVAANLPERLIELRHETELLYDRVSRIDSDIFQIQKEETEQTDAAGQLRALEAAFGKN